MRKGVDAVEEKYKSYLLKFAYWASIALLAVVFLKYLLSPLVPFIIALCISALIRPLVMRMAQIRGVKEKAAAIVLALLTYILLAGLAVLLFIGIISALADWAGQLPTLFTETVSPWIVEKSVDLSLWIERIAPDMDISLDKMLPDAVSSMGGSIINFSGKVVSWVSSIGARLPRTMLATVICVIATIFVSADYEKLRGAVAGALPEKIIAILRKVRKAFKDTILKYAKSYALILLITFAEICVGLLIIGFENAPLIACAIAVFDILPIVGSGMVLLPWTVIVFIQGQTIKGLGLAILYVTVIVVRQIMEPKIVGKQVGLHPLVTLMCMWIGLKLAGGVGMFVVPISLLILKNLYEEGYIRLGKNRTEIPTEVHSDQG